jgi:hypothetical protein
MDLILTASTLYAAGVPPILWSFAPLGSRGRLPLRGHRHAFHAQIPTTSSKIGNSTL